MTPIRVVTCGMARRTCRKLWVRAAAIAGVAAVAVICAACGGGDSPTTASTRPPTTATTTTPQAAVVAAYRASQAAFDQAIRNANPTLPTLTKTMSGTELTSVRRALETDKLDGIVGKGSVRVHPKVISLKDSRAVVHDCAFDTSELVYAATSKPVPPITGPEHDGITATLSETAAGIWKVSQETVTQGSCPAGY